MKRPTIFISSTIYDFRDLRSSLKDYLELRGCRVLASEFNDFEKDLEPHSYQACLNAIDNADLFLLLIGNRVGGMVDFDERISITRAEYRHAYQLATRGKIKILSFVRSEVFNYRESLKEMSRFLKTEMSRDRENEINLADAPSKFMSDAKTVINFIEEVSRNTETNKAVKENGIFPKANWLHQFNSFSDIRQQLDLFVLDGLDVSDAVGRTALLELLKRLLQDSLMQVSGNAIIPSVSVRNLVNNIGLNINMLNENVSIPIETWSKFVTLVILLDRASPDSAPLLPFLSSPLLLNYDPSNNRFSPTPEHSALRTLVQQIAAYNTAKSDQSFVKLVSGVDVSSGGPAMTSTSTVAGHLHLLIRWAEMAETATALAKSMIMGKYVAPALMPRSPFVDQEAELEAEELTMDQVESFLGILP